MQRLYNTPFQGSLYFFILYSQAVGLCFINPPFQGFSVSRVGAAKRNPPFIDCRDSEPTLRLRHNLTPLPPFPEGKGGGGR